MAYDNTNRGVLFKNDKQGNEKRPDYTGSINIDGQERFLDAWIKEGKNGKFLSLSTKPKTGKPQRTSNPAPPEDSDDIPFAPIGRWL